MEEDLIAKMSRMHSPMKTESEDAAVLPVVLAPPSQPKARSLLFSAWDTFKIGFATPVDYNTRFRMIIGDLATRSKRGEVRATSGKIEDRPADMGSN